MLGKLNENIQLMFRTDFTTPLMKMAKKNKSIGKLVF